MEEKLPPQTIKSPRDGETMHLVWHDEFDGDKLDGEKWIIFDRMYGSKGTIVSYEDERHISVQDGKLVMRTFQEADGTWSINKAVTSTGRMSYLFGYAEARCRFPFAPGCFPSFWLQSAPEHRTQQYMTEVDVMEPYFYGYLESSLSCWFLKDSPTGFGAAYCNDWFEPTRYTLPGFEAYWRFWDFQEAPVLTDAQKAAIAEWNSKFHTYGFGWTENEMYFTLDGKLQGTVDLVTHKPGGRNPIGTTMDDPRIQAVKDVVTTEGYRKDAMFFNFTSWVGSSFRYKSYGSPAQDTQYPVNFEVDYVRLYQKEGEGKLYDDRGKGGMTQEKASAIPTYG